MKIKLGQIFNAKEALDNLVKQQLPILITHRLQMFIKSISPHLETFLENRNNLVLKYGTPPDKDGQSFVSPEKFNDFFEEYNPYINMEIEVDFEKFNLLDLGNKCTLSVIELNLLDFLIND